MGKIEITMSYGEFSLTFAFFWIMMTMQIQVCFDVDVAETLRFTTVLIVRSLDDFPLVGHPGLCL